MLAALAQFKIFLFWLLVVLPSVELVVMVWWFTLLLCVHIM